MPVLADFKVGEGFSLQAGPQIGFVVTDKLEAEGESEELDAESTDFGAVLGAQYKMETGLFIQAGPQIGFLISATDEFKSSSDSGEDDIKDRLNSVDLGANIGLAYQFNSGLIFGARYNLGLSNINDIAGSDLKNQNGVFQFSVGFKFQ